MPRLKFLIISKRLRLGTVIFHNHNLKIPVVGFCKNGIQTQL